MGPGVALIGPVATIANNSSVSLDSQLMDSTHNVSGHHASTTSPKPRGTELAAAANHRMRTSGIWSKIATWTTKFPYNWMYFLLAASLSIGVGAAVFIGEGLKLSTDMIANIPRGSALHDGYMQLTSSFGSGLMWPYKLLIVPPPHSGGVLSKDTWETCQDIVTGIGENPKLYDTSIKTFNFPFLFGGMKVPWECVAPACVGNTCFECPQFAQQLVHIGLQEFVNNDHTGVFGYVNLPWDSLDPKHGQNWLSEMRRILKEWEAKLPGYQLQIGGTPTILWDESLVMMQIFPFIVCGCLSISFLVLAVAFKSILIPLRSMMSIILTQVFVFGLAVLTFQYGILDFLGLPGLSSDLKGVELHMPIAVFSIIVGLALDYDIFLLTRAMEETSVHLDTKEGIRSGVAYTGSVITTAGIIMAFAFGGLLFSSMATVNQLGFFLVVAALYDTFVSRCLLTPSIMSMFGDKNWWPGPVYYKVRRQTLQAEIATARGREIATSRQGP